MVSAAYDAIAGWYDEQVREGRLVHQIVMPALLDVIGEVAGQRVCDLACGQGVVSRALAERGAQVVGVDISEELLAIARREQRVEQDERNAYPIEYRRDDAQHGAALADADFDGVVCNLALTDIPDLGATLQTVHRILRPSGWFACSIFHPAIHMTGSSWQQNSAGVTYRRLGDYFAEGLSHPQNTHVGGRVGKRHYMLSTVLQTLIDARLQLDRVIEPQASEALLAQFPERDDFRVYRELPVALVMRCRHM